MERHKKKKELKTLKDPLRFQKAPNKNIFMKNDWKDQMKK